MSTTADEVMRRAAAFRETAATTAERLWSEAAAHQAAEVMAGRHGYMLRFRELLFRPDQEITPPHLATASTLSVAAFNNGLFANVLQVLDAALLADGTGAALLVDWTCRHELTHFYGEVDRDLWPLLFEPLPSIPRSVGFPTEHVTNRLNPLLLAPSRGLYFNSPFFATHRRTYGETFARTFRPLAHWMREINEVYEEPKLVAARSRGARVVGVHCRLTSAGAMRAQSTGTMVSCASSLDLIRAALDPTDVLLIASDAAEDAAAVVTAIGVERCVLRANVMRAAVAGTETEVHNRPGGASLRDAADALIDAWLLSRSDVLLHNSESCLVLAIAFLRPSLELVPLSRAAVGASESIHPTPPPLDPPQTFSLTSTPPHPSPSPPPPQVAVTENGLSRLSIHARAAEASFELKGILDALHFFEGDDFWSEYWEKVPALVPQNTLLPELPTIAGLLGDSRKYTYHGNVKKTRSFKVFSGGFYAPAQVKWPAGFDVGGTELAEVLQRGWTVVFDSVQRWSQPLLELATRTGRVFGRRTSVNMYLSAACLPLAMDAHNDQHDFVVVQVSNERGSNLRDLWSRTGYMVHGTGYMVRKSNRGSNRDRPGPHAHCSTLVLTSSMVANGGGYGSLRIGCYRSRGGVTPMVLALRTGSMPRRSGRRIQMCCLLRVISSMCREGWFISR